MKSPDAALLQEQEQKTKDLEAKREQLEQLRANASTSKDKIEQLEKDANKTAEEIEDLKKLLAAAYGTSSSSSTNAAPGATANAAPKTAEPFDPAKSVEESYKEWNINTEELAKEFPSFALLSPGQKRYALNKITDSMERLGSIAVQVAVTESKNRVAQNLADAKKKGFLAGLTAGFKKENRIDTKKIAKEAYEKAVKEFNDNPMTFVKADMFRILDQSRQRAMTVDEYGDINFEIIDTKDPSNPDQERPLSPEAKSAIAEFNKAYENLLSIPRSYEFASDDEDTFFDNFRKWKNTTSGKKEDTYYQANKRFREAKRALFEKVGDTKEIPARALEMQIGAAEAMLELDRFQEENPDIQAVFKSLGMRSKEITGIDFGDGEKGKVAEFFSKHWEKVTGFGVGFAAKSAVKGALLASNHAIEATGAGFVISGAVGAFKGMIRGKREVAELRKGAWLANTDKEGQKTADQKKIRSSIEKFKGELVAMRASITALEQQIATETDATVKGTLEKQLQDAEAALKQNKKYASLQEKLINEQAALSKSELLYKGQSVDADQLAAKLSFLQEKVFNAPNEYERAKAAKELDRRIEYTERKLASNEIAYGKEATNSHYELLKKLSMARFYSEQESGAAFKTMDRIFTDDVRLALDEVAKKDLALKTALEESLSKTDWSDLPGLILKEKTSGALKDIDSAVVARLWRSVNDQTSNRYYRKLSAIQDANHELRLKAERMLVYKRAIKGAGTAVAFGALGYLVAEYTPAGEYAHAGWEKVKHGLTAIIGEENVHEADNLANEGLDKIKHFLGGIFGHEHANEALKHAAGTGDATSAKLDTITKATEQPLSSDSTTTLEGDSTTTATEPGTVTGNGTFSAEDQTALENTLKGVKSAETFSSDTPEAQQLIETKTDITGELKKTLADVKGTGTMTMETTPSDSDVVETKGDLTGELKKTLSGVTGEKAGALSGTGNVVEAKGDAAVELKKTLAGIKGEGSLTTEPESPDADVDADVETLPEGSTLSAAAEKGDGFSNMILKLRHSAEYKGLPENVRSFLGKNATTVSEKLGAFLPHATNESAMILPGDQVGVNKDTLEVFIKRGGETITLGHFNEDGAFEGSDHEGLTFGHTEHPTIEKPSTITTEAKIDANGNQVIAEENPYKVAGEQSVPTNEMSSSVANPLHEENPYVNTPASTDETGQWEEYKPQENALFNTTSVGHVDASSHTVLAQTPGNYDWNVEHHINPEHLLTGGDDHYYDPSADTHGAEHPGDDYRDHEHGHYRKGHHHKIIREKEEVAEAKHHHHGGRHHKIEKDVDNTPQATEEATTRAQEAAIEAAAEKRNAALDAMALDKLEHTLSDVFPGNGQGIESDAWHKLSNAPADKILAMFKEPISNFSPRTVGVTMSGEQTKLFSAIGKLARETGIKPEHINGRSEDIESYLIRCLRAKAEKELV